MPTMTMFSLVGFLWAYLQNCLLVINFIYLRYDKIRQETSVNEGVALVAYNKNGLLFTIKIFLVFNKGKNLKLLKNSLKHNDKILTNMTWCG